jgi:site-specific recombinase XerC
MKNKKNELTVIDDTGNVISGTIPKDTDPNSSMNERYKTISGYFVENPEKLEQQVLLNKLARIRGQDYEISLINFEVEIDNFISLQTSDQTKRVYKISIYKFREFCKEHDLHPLKVSVKNVDDYMFSLMKKGLSSRSVRLYIASLSSFYEFLHLRYFEVIKINPFLKRKLPKIKDKFQKDFVKKEDFKVLCSELKRIKRPDILCCIELLYKYGWRIGIFKNFVVNDDLTWESISKGEYKKGKITKSEYNKIINSGLLKIKSWKTISSKIKKFTIRLKNNGKISCSFSVHDLRRARILEDLKNENAENFIKVSRKYHKSINTTYGYVASNFDR